MATLPVTVSPPHQSAQREACYQGAQREVSGEGALCSQSRVQAPDTYGCKRALLLHVETGGYECQARVVMEET